MRLFSAPRDVGALGPIALRGQAPVPCSPVGVHNRAGLNSLLDEREQTDVGGIRQRRQPNSADGVPDQEPPA